jgi:hypothetical protein
LSLAVPPPFSPLPSPAELPGNPRHFNLNSHQVKLQLLCPGTPLLRHPLVAHDSHLTTNILGV